METDKNITLFLEGVQDLTPEAKLQISTIFEAAVNEALSEKVQEIDSSMKTLTESRIQEVVEHTDEYVTEAAKQWLEDNKLVIESEQKVAKAESLFEALSDLLGTYGITEGKSEDDDEEDDEKEKMKKEMDDLKEANASLVAEVAKLQKFIVESAMEKALVEACEGLTDTQKDKMKTLSESIKFTNIQDYGQRLSILKEAFIGEKALASKKPEALTEARAETVTQDDLITEAKKEAPASKAIADALKFADRL